jgi:3-hydroxyisobutyrate dehydrogenase
MITTVGFVGIGTIGAKLAATLLRNGFDVAVLDLEPAAATPLLDAGAEWRRSPADLACARDLVITCLPSPAASAAVVEGPDGLLRGLRPGAVWAEMSTTDHEEVRRLAARVTAAGAAAVDCPVSGGCHRATTGNIAILAGCERPVFERVLPVLTTLGRRVLHTGPVGTASVLKVITNYLATANLVTLAEALVTATAAGMDLAVTYEAIRISSGNSFVHETEGQVILNGSRDISFTMDLVRKDLSLFQAIADHSSIPVEVAPLLRDVFDDAHTRYGPREWSPNVIRRLEDATGLDVLAAGFPPLLIDDEPEEAGHEVLTRGG